jgi:hypothetical protein
VNVGGSKRLRSQSHAHDHLVSIPVNALHVSRLSSSHFLVGLDANGKELTCRTSILCSWSKNL